ASLMMLFARSSVSASNAAGDTRFAKLNTSWSACERWSRSWQTITCAEVRRPRILCSDAATISAAVMGLGFIVARRRQEKVAVEADRQGVDPHAVAVAVLPAPGCSDVDNDL